MAISLKIRESVIAFAKNIEEEFGVRCLVVSNKYRIPFVPNQEPLSITLLPANGDSKEVFESNANAAFMHYQQTQILRNDWHGYFAFLDNIEPWFSRFASRKGNFPLADMAAGADLISPAIYGKEYLSDLQEKAENFFGKGIIEFWKKEAAIQRKEKDKRFNTLRREDIAYRKERGRLLNKYELEELREFVQFIVEKCDKEAISFVVALDGSGRPIGKALEWLGINCPVVYLDPNYLRSVNFSKAIEVELVKKSLKRDFPEIHEALSKNPLSVFFVDDQTGYGNTGKALESLVKLFSGSDGSLLYATMTPYMGNNTPSWLRKRDIQGIELAPEKSFRAIDVPTAKSRKFYNKLKRIVLAWA